jgi:hypothetical protein
MIGSAVFTLAWCTKDYILHLIIRLKEHTLQFLVHRQAKMMMNFLFDIPKTAPVPEPSIWQVSVCILLTA